MSADDAAADVDLATGLEIEWLHFSGLFATDDARAGLRAFADKTKPEFTGR